MDNTNLDIKNALIADAHIHELAAYYETEGATNCNTDSDKIYSRFVEFKRRIMTGAISAEELEWSVVEKFSILTK